MNKDFSQKFIRNETVASLIIEDAPSGRFILFMWPDEVQEYGEADAARTLDLKLTNTGSIAWQVAKYLMTEGMALNSIREVASETEVSFSLAGDVAGSETEMSTLHVRVDLTDRQVPNRNALQLFSLNEYASRLQGALFSNRVLDLGITRLQLEQTMNGDNKRQPNVGSL